MHSPPETRPPIYWQPGPWLRGLSQVAMWVAIFWGMMFVFRVTAPLTRGMEFRLAISIGVLIGFLLVAVVVHELGHYVAARWRGMSVWSVRLGPLGFTPQRDRWLRHWIGGSHWISGAVMAFPDIGRAFRPQMYWFILGGAFGNFAVAALAGAVGVFLPGSPTGQLLLAFAVINALLGLTNLLPAGPDWDGSQLIRVIKGADLGQPGTEALELNMRAMRGDTADEAPEALMLGAERESPALGLWFRIFAALNRQDWEALRALGVRLEDWQSLLDRPSREAWSTFTGVLRAEIHFGRAIQDGMSPPPVDAEWVKFSRRARPGTVERHEALLHALAGRVTERDAALVLAEQESEYNLDPAARKTETRLRQVVRDLATG